MKSIKLSMLAALMLTAGITTVKAQSADEIIQKHIDAIGGKSWDKINSIKMNGSMSVQGMDIAMSQTVANGKGMRIEMTVMGMTGYIIVTPTGGWTYLPFQGQTKPEAVPVDQLKDYAGKLDVKSQSLADKSQIEKAELIGKDTINNVACYKLKITDKSKNEQTAYIDLSTFYLIRTEVKVKGQDDAEQEVAMNYSNFQKQPEGITLPMTTGSPQGDIIYKTVEINKPLDENTFKPAAETK